MPRRRPWIKTVPPEIYEEVDMEVVAFLGQMQAEVLADMREVVVIARDKGYTWQQIGDAQGVTKSAVVQRFGKLPTETWTPWGKRHAQPPAVVPNSRAV